MPIRSSTALFLLVVMAVVPAGRGADDRPPPEVQKALVKALQARVDELAKEKDDNERIFRRGFFSRSFHPTGDGAYLATFHRDTIEGEHIKTERLTLTLRPSVDDAGAFTIDGETVDDTFTGLHRGAIGDERFFRFDSFEFDREGMRVKAAHGTFYKDFLDGKPSRFVLHADTIEYGYTPPADWGSYSRIHGALVEDDTKDFVFEPQFAALSCDPASCAELLSSCFRGVEPVERDAAGETLIDSLDEAKRDAERVLEQNPFAFFRLPPEPDHRYWTISVRRGSSDHWAWLSYDNEEPLEMSFGVSGRWPALFSYPTASSRGEGLSPWEIERRDDAEARDYEIEGLKGTVELALVDAEDMTGDLTYRLRIKREIDKLPFAIVRLRPQGDASKEARSPSMIVNSLQDGDGDELTWVKTGTISGLVLLGRKVPAGSELTLRIQFEAKKSIYNYNWSFSYLSRGGWLPFVRFGDMIPDFDLTVKVPERYETLGICTQVESRVEDGVSITRWKAQSPIVFPTVIFGVYVDDESEVEAKRLDGTKIPVSIHVDKNGMTDWGIVPKQLRPIANQAAESLNFYRDVFGVDYPYAKLDLVNDPFGSFYGQAPSSIVYLGSGVFRGEGTLGSAGGSNLTYFVKSVVPHEVAHQWWGSLIANANDRSYWFVESLAEFSSALFMEAKFGPKKYREHVESWRREILETDLMSSVQDASTLWSGGGFGGYRAAVYSKGPYAFHILRTTFGDEKMKQFLRAMATELAGKEIVTRDIQKVAEEVYGGTMEWFFDQWIRGLGIPEYRLEWSQRATEDGKYLVEGKIHQRVVVGLDKNQLDGVYFRGRIPLAITFKGGKESFAPVIVDGATTEFRFKIPQKADKVALNKYGESLSFDVGAGSSF